MKVRVVAAIIIALTAAALLLPLAASALEPPRPGELDKYQRNGSLAAREAFASKLGNDKVAPRLVQRLQSRLRAQVLGLDAPSMAPPLLYRGMPTTGTNKILVLCIDFSDYPAQTTTAAIDNKVFGAGDAAQYPRESLRNFYLRSSYDQLDIQGSVLGWYRAPMARSAVPLTDVSREDLIKQALTYYDATIDYSQFDNNHDGKIDYFAVLWTGPDNGWGNFWWGYQTSWGATAAPSLDGVTPDTYSWQWEVTWSSGVPAGTFSPHVIIHETGHALGLPDYYDYQSKAQGDTIGPDGGIGDYDMMDAATGDHNAFSKWLLDWIAPPVVSWVTRTQTLGPSCTNKTGSSLVVMPGLAAGNWNAEFFLLQNRNKVWDSNDRYMPGTHGLQIWHVDARLDGFGWDYLSNNSYTAHKLLRLQEADGLEKIEQNYAMDAGDYYTAGTQIGTSGTPNTKRYDGADSGIVVDTISELDRDVSFRVVGGYDHSAPTSWCNQTISSGWYTSFPTFTFGGSDTGGSGFLRAEYRVDGGSWQPSPTGALSDGLRALEWRGVDNAENYETPHTATVKVDTLAPTTTVGNSDTLWHKSDVTLSFSAVDPGDAGGSGISYVQRKIDSAAWTPGTSLLVPAAADHSNDGAHTVQWQAVDNAGNWESPQSCTVNIDTTGPTTSDDGDSLWHRSPYTLSVTATDPNSGVGVVYMAVGSGATLARSQVTIRTRRHKIGNGAHRVYYFALDELNNYGDSHFRDVLIDDEKPTTTTNFVSGAIVYGPFTVVLTPHDKYSGVVSPGGIHYRTSLNGLPWSAWTTGSGGTIPAPPSGQYAGTVEYYSVDRAGNQESTKSASLTIRPAGGALGLYFPPPPR